MPGSSLTPKPRAVLQLCRTVYMPVFPQLSDGANCGHSESGVSSGLRSRCSGEIEHAMILIGEGELGVLGKPPDRRKKRERGSWWELPRLGAQGPGSPQGA